MKKVMCHECKKQIKKEYDISTGFHGFLIKPYHIKCYEIYGPFHWRLLKHTMRELYEMNSITGTIIAIQSGIFGPIFLVLGLGALLQGGISTLAVLATLFGIMLIILAAGRIYSYYKYEKWFNMRKR